MPDASSVWGTADGKVPSLQAGLMPDAYCLLPVACCLLPIACCLLSVAWCLITRLNIR